MTRDYIYITKHAKLEMEYLYTVETSITIVLHVESYGFIATYNFCLQKELVVEAVANLKNMSEGTSQECKILDSDSDAYLALYYENKELFITGQLGGSHEENYMKYKFAADQTVIKLLSTTLSNYLKY